MNIFRAEAYLAEYGNNKVKLQELYDDDEMLQATMVTLFPGFEYPDFAILTMEEIRKRYAAAKLPVQTRPSEKPTT